MRTRIPPFLIHAVGCITFLALPILSSPDFSQSDNMVYVIGFRRDFLSYLFLLGFFYANYYYLLSRYYFRQQYIIYFAIVFACFVAAMALPHLLVPWHGMPHVPPRFYGHGMPPPMRSPMLHKMNEYFVLFVLAFFFALFLKINERLKLAEKAKADAELSYLKAQINPHFLFNTLNSIYALAIVKSDRTANAVVKLSGMMRYVLSDMGADYVPLDKEISYIADYIELQKIRVEGSVKLQYEIVGSQTGKKIAPLILMPFIENAFKYGVNSEEDARISIAIAIGENELYMRVENNKVKAMEGVEKTGVGLDNTRSRLSILYPNKHTLQIDDDEQTFLVLLKIDLT